VPTSSCRKSPATHNPIVEGIAADRLQAQAAAISALAQAGGWSVIKIAVDIAVNGEASYHDLSCRLQMPLPTVHWAVRSASIGRYERNPDPAKPGRVIKPKLPGLLHIRPTGSRNGKVVALAPAGIEFINALQGSWS